MTEKEQKSKIEFEQVTINIPKPIMAFIHSQPNASGLSLEQEIEHYLINSVQIDMENLSGRELIDRLELGPMFNELLVRKKD